MKFVSNGAGETQKFAADIAKQVIAGSFSQAVVIALEGDLGSGKTTFTQGFIRQIVPRARVKSPTFLVMKEYPVPKQKKAKKSGKSALKKLKLGFSKIFHLDCYRIKSASDIKSIHIRDMVSDPSHIVLVEWPEKIKSALPKRIIRISFKHGGKDKRIITVQ